MQNVHKSSEVSLSVRVGHTFLRPSILNSIGCERDTVSGMCCGCIVKDVVFGWGDKHSIVSDGHDKTFTGSNVLK